MTTGLAASDLFAIVERYSDFGNHHTGTDVDRATTAWLIDLLTRLGATVEENSYTFDRFVATAELTTDDVASVPCLPLFYSATGTVDTDRFDTFEADAAVVGSAHALDELLPSTSDPTPLIIALDGPDDLAVQCNRVPTRLLGRPAVVIPGNWLDRVRQGARLRFDGSLEPATSANVIATLGNPTAPTVTVTTPLTGWTPAAGERGTGLAAALFIASELASTHHVVFSACSGHEIDHLGLRHFLSTRDLTNQTVIHLGASVAACEPDDSGSLRLGQRITLTTATGAARSAIKARAADGNWNMADREPPWPGEGGTWLNAGARVLSFLGGSTLFHTLDDVPDKATTPAAIELAATVALDAVRMFLMEPR